MQGKSWRSCLSPLRFASTWFVPDRVIRTKCVVSFVALHKRSSELKYCRDEGQFVLFAFCLRQRPSFDYTSCLVYSSILFSVSFVMQGKHFSREMILCQASLFVYQYSFLSLLLSPQEDQSLIRYFFFGYFFDQGSRCLCGSKLKTSLFITSFHEW